MLNEAALPYCLSLRECSCAQHDLALAASTSAKKIIVMLNEVKQLTASYDSQ